MLRLQQGYHFLINKKPTYSGYQVAILRVDWENVQHHACLNQLYGQTTFQNPSRYLQKIIETQYLSQTS